MGKGFSSGNSSDKKSTWTRSPVCSTVEYPRFNTTTATLTTTLTTATTTATISTTTTSTASRTTTTTTTWGFPSLLCFVVMRAYTPEMDLVKEQFKQRVGIFQCDEYVVLSNQVVVLGETAPNATVKSWLNPAPQLSMGDMAQAGVTTNSWLNTAIFINAFELILN